MTDFNKENDLHSGAPAQQPTAAAQPLTRREVAKKAAAGVGLAALGSALPRVWVPPVMQIGMMPEHGMASKLTPEERAAGTQVNTRVLRRAPVEPPTQNTNTAPTEGPPPSGDSVTPPPAPVPNADSSGGGDDGSSTQPSLDIPEGNGGLSCPPTDVVASPINVRVVASSTSATVTWDGQGERSFMLDVYQYGYSDPVVSVTNLGTVRSIPGLRPCTEYYVEVYARRCPGFDSDGYGYQSFHTLMAADAVPAVSIPESNIYCDGFYANWMQVPCATGYEVQLSFDGGVSWYTTTQDSYETTASVTGLCPGDSVHIRVRAVGGDGRIKGPFSPTRTVRTKTESDNPYYPCECGSESPSNENTTDSNPI